MTRSRSYRRTQRRRAIHHKAMILRDYWGLRGDDYWTPARLGALAKGKVHCSCWMCRTKSFDNPRIMDVRNALSLEQDLREYETERMEGTEHGPLYPAEQADKETPEGIS